MSVVDCWLRVYVLFGIVNICKGRGRKGRAEGAVTWFFNVEHGYQDLMAHPKDPWYCPNNVERKTYNQTVWHADYFNFPCLSSNLEILRRWRVCAIIEIPSSEGNCSHRRPCLEASMNMFMILSTRIQCLWFLWRSSQRTSHAGRNIAHHFSAPDYTFSFGVIFVFCLFFVCVLFCP